MRRGRLLVALLCGAAVVLLALAGFVALSRRDQSAASRLIGKPMPTLVMTDAESGESFALAAPGRILVVNFWAPWCVPCLGEHRMLNAAAATLDSDNVALVGIAYQSDQAAISTFLNKVGRTVRSLQDVDGRASIEFGVTGVPETFVVDQYGIVRGHISGPISKSQLLDLIAAVTNTPATGSSANVAP